MKFLILLVALIQAQIAWGDEPCFGMKVRTITHAESYQNEEMLCPARDGIPFISINGRDVPMFMDPQTAQSCNSGVGPAREILNGCILENMLNRNGDNLFAYKISNVSDQTYVYVSTSVILNPGEANELFLWKDLRRQGRGSDQKFSDSLNKRFSTILLQSGGGESGGKSYADIQEILDEAEQGSSFLDETLRNIRDMESSLSEILNKSLEWLDPISLGDSVPNWFKTLLTDLKSGVTDLKEEAERALSELNYQISGLANAAKKALSDEGISLDGIVQNPLDISEIGEVNVDTSDEGEEYPEDNVFSRRAAAMIEDLKSKIEARDRIGFAETVYQWILEKESLDELMLKRAGVIKGEWEAYFRSQEQIYAFVRLYMDDYLYFKSSNIPDSVKESLEKSQAPRAIKKKLRDSLLVRDFDPSNPRTNRMFDSVTEVSQAFNGPMDSDATTAMSAIASGLANALSTGLDIVTDVATCVAKSVAAGPYSDYYELRYQKSFCDDSELADWEVAVSGVSLGFTIVTSAAATPIGGAIVDKVGKTLKAVFQVGQRIWKSARATKAAELTERAFRTAKSLEMHSADDVKALAGAIADVSDLRLAKIVSETTRILPSGQVQTFSPDIIKFTQTSVNGVEELTESMRRLGWPESAGAIDVVKLSDGTLATVDNTRVLAASRVGIDVRATVRSAGEAIDPSRAVTLKDRYGNIPQTWEQAVKNRISTQSKAYRERYPNGSYVTGSVE